MAPKSPLPYDESFFSDATEYSDSLLDFVAASDFLRTLCGGVHILDFFTSESDLYARVIPQEWRAFFARHQIMELLNLMMRDDLEDRQQDSVLGNAPSSLIKYIKRVRKHLLHRQPTASQCARNRAMKPTQKLARHVAVGMNVKKVHEVGLFASYIDGLASDIADLSDRPVTHLVDFGSGQNYLGRALASEPYNRNIVAIESKAANAEKAREFDIQAKLVEKQRVLRNKKAFRAGLEGPGISVPEPLATPPPETASGETASSKSDTLVQTSPQGTGKIIYVDHVIVDGQLNSVVTRIHPTAVEPSLMVMSLHSCGNLVHHGLRSLLLNHSVTAVAMVGCCYNLVTERLGPATYKLPQLRPTTYMHPRLEATGEANDPHGFPMSNRLCQFRSTSSPDAPPGARLNITSRMMAVQAPQNWGESDSASFFTRHFYRALLQRVFLERGVVGRPSPEFVGGMSAAGHSSGGTPIVTGSLRKHCYENFVNYVRGALDKLRNDAVLGDLIREKMEGITDAEIAEFETRYAERKKDLSVTWSLMAFSAGVIEATIVVDRWLWLKEQEEVREAWVEPVFDYNISPRNLVVVGIKK